MTVNCTPELLYWPLFRKPERLQVMFAILLSRAEDGSISPSVIDRLPSMTGLSAVSVQRSLQDLVDAGVLMPVSCQGFPDQFVVTALPDGILPQSPSQVKPADDIHVHNEAIKSPPKKRFVKPTLEEAAAYINEHHYSVDPQYFMDYEESVGWTVGSTHKPMKDWKAAIRNMERNNRKTPPAVNGGQKPLSSYEQQRQSSRDLYLASEAGVSLQAIAGACLESIPDIAPCDGTASLVPSVSLSKW